MRLKTPCCNNSYFMFILVGFLVLGLIAYVHLPHRSNSDFFSSKIGEKTHDMLIRSREGFLGGGKKNTKKGDKKEGDEKKEDEKKEDEKEGDEEGDEKEVDDEEDEKGILNKRPKKSEKKEDWKTAEEWSREKRPKFDVEYEPFNRKYIQLYDKLTFVTKKFDYETMIIMRHLKSARIFSGVHILDVGCGTGHHVAFLKNKGYDVVGLDKSKEAVNYCKNVHTQHADSFQDGDALLRTLFRDNIFSHILCLNSTIYYMKDIPQFFKNCAAWLKEDGIMFVHMIDEVEQRYFETNGWMNAKNGLRYKSSYDVQGRTTLITEKIKDKDDNAMVNQHTLYNVGKTEMILKAAKANGFSIIKKYTLKKSGFRHQYIYVMQC